MIFVNNDKLIEIDVLAIIAKWNKTGLLEGLDSDDKLQSKIIYIYT